MATSPKYGSLLSLLVCDTSLTYSAALFSRSPNTGSKCHVKAYYEDPCDGIGDTFRITDFAALRENNWDVVKVLKIVRDNRAVAALGWDWLFIMRSDGAWVWMGGMIKI